MRAVIEGACEGGARLNCREYGGIFRRRFEIEGSSITLERLVEFLENYNACRLTPE